MSAKDGTAKKPIALSIGLARLINGTSLLADQYWLIDPGLGAARAYYDIAVACRALLRARGRVFHQ